MKGREEKGREGNESKGIHGKGKIRKDAPKKVFP